MTDFHACEDCVWCTFNDDEVLCINPLFDEYDIKDGETPEIIAEKVYGTAEYHWIIMLINEKFDYLADFPMTYDALLKYVEDKYGVGNEYAIHHHKNANGFVVNYDELNAEPVTNLQHEEIINESKRRIKLVSPQIIARILKQFNELL